MTDTYRRGAALISEADFLKAVEASIAKRGEAAAPLETRRDVCPPDCSVENLSAMFASLDLNRDGGIGKEELRVCLALIGQQVRDETLEMMILLADTDNDGFVTVSDFVDFFQHPGDRIDLLLAKLMDTDEVAVGDGEEALALEDGAETAAAPAPEKDAQTEKTVEIVHALLGIDTIHPKDIKALYRKFNEADTKKVGKLNLFQFEKMFDSYQFVTNRKLRSSYIGHLFAFCDSDKSSYIDAKEFMIGLCWLSDFSNIDKLRFAFMLFDLNNNGKMSRSELVQLLGSVNIGEGKKEIIKTRVDEILQKVSGGPNTDWAEYQLTFEQLVRVADENPDLFQSLDRRPTTEK